MMLEVGPRKWKAAFASTVLVPADPADFILFHLVSQSLSNSPLLSLHSLSPISFESDR
jgi:hypothetical protein